MARQVARVGGLLDLRKTQFTTISTLADAHLASRGKGIPPEDYEVLAASELLETWQVDEDSTVRRRISTLRRRLSVALGEGSDEIIENIAWHGYRLRPETVEVRNVDLGAS